MVFLFPMVVYFNRFNIGGGKIILSKGGRYYDIRNSIHRQDPIHS